MTGKDEREICNLGKNKKREKKKKGFMAKVSFKRQKKKKQI